MFKFLLNLTLISAYLLFFLQPIGEDDFTHAIQDQDHGAPSSQRTSHAEHDKQQGLYYGAPQDSSSSYSGSTFSSGYPRCEYTRPQISDCPPVTWVYEWQEPKWYAQLYAQWQTTVQWTGESWHDYKATLLRNQSLMLMSTEEYYMANQQWNYN